MLPLRVTTEIQTNLSYFLMYHRTAKPISTKGSKIPETRGQRTFYKGVENLQLPFSGDFMPFLVWAGGGGSERLLRRGTNSEFWVNTQDQS